MHKLGMPKVRLPLHGSKECGGAGWAGALGLAFARGPRRWACPRHASTVPLFLPRVRLRAQGVLHRRRVMTLSPLERHFLAVLVWAGVMLAAWMGWV